MPRTSYRDKRNRRNARKSRKEAYPTQSPTEEPAGEEALIEIHQLPIIGFPCSPRGSVIRCPGFQLRAQCLANPFQVA